MAIEFNHKSVLLDECIEALNIRPGYTYVDCTTGGGGHSLEIVKRIGSNAQLICFDRDITALSAAKERLAAYSDRVIFINENFSELGRVLDELGVTNLGGVLADLGCSSYQFDTPSRGFAYNHDAPLDMRMDTSGGKTARDVVNEYDESELKKIIYDYGEERFAPQIARKIVAARESSPIETTFELSEIIKSAIPRAARDQGPHPAKRTFQAIRIEVNGELDAISPLIMAAEKRMMASGRMAIISFHSLEDRIVKQTYATLASGCECPKHLPVCVCGKTPKIKIVSKKPVLPSDAELEENPRSRSAKLRIAEKL